MVQQLMPMLKQPPKEYIRPDERTSPGLSVLDISNLDFD